MRQLKIIKKDDINFVKMHASNRQKESIKFKHIKLAIKLFPTLNQVQNIIFALKFL